MNVSHVTSRTKVQVRRGARYLARLPSEISRARWFCEAPRTGKFLHVGTARHRKRGLTGKTEKPHGGKPLGVSTKEAVVV